MRVSALISGFFAMAVAGTGAQADWMNPTSGRDCQDGLQELFQQREMLRVNERQCHNSQTEDYWAGRVQYRTFLCGDLPRHQGVYTLETCSQEAQAICNVELEIPRRRALCQSRLEDHRTRQAALRAQQEEAERLQRDRGNAAQQDGFVGLVDRIGATYVQENYLSLSDGPQELAGDMGREGERIARLFGVQRTGNQSAHTLSAAMTEVGTDIMVQLNARALEDLETALGNFDAANPRPTMAQLEEFYGQRADLAAQYAEHMTRVQNTDYRLPLGDESAVVGAYADAIIQLVEMRNAGEISEPIAALGAAAATVLAVRAYREAEERAAQERAETQALQPLDPEQLRTIRQATLAPVRSERARIAEAERQAELAQLNALALAEQDVGSAGSTAEARSCLEWASPERRSVRNTCSRPVWCLNASDVWAEYIPAAIATRYLTRMENGFPTGNAPNGRMVFAGGAFMAWPEDLRNCGFARGAPVTQPVAPYVGPAQTAAEAFGNMGGSGLSTGSGSLE